MAVAARKLRSEAYMPATRVYSHTAEARAQRRREELEALARKKAAAAAARKSARQAALTRLFMIVTVAVAAAAMLLVLMRYSNISEEYARVNALKTQIADTELALKGLNVELNSAVSLEDAREAAIAAGLGYPSAEQVVTVSPQSHGALDLTPAAAQAAGKGDMVEVITQDGKPQAPE